MNRYALLADVKTKFPDIELSVKDVTNSIL